MNEEVKIEARWVLETNRQGSSWGNHDWDVFNSFYRAEDAIDALINIEKVWLEISDRAYDRASEKINAIDFGDDDDARDAALDAEEEKFKEKILADLASELKRDGDASIFVDVEGYRVREVRCVVDECGLEVELDLDDKEVADIKWISITNDSRQDVVLVRRLPGTKAYLALQRDSVEVLVYSTNADWRIVGNEDDICDNWLRFNAAGMLGNFLTDSPSEESAMKVRDIIEEEMYEEDAGWFLDQYEVAVNFARLLDAVVSYAGGLVDEAKDVEKSLGYSINWGEISSETSEIGKKINDSDLELMEFVESEEMHEVYKSWADYMVDSKGELREEYRAFKL